MATGQVGFKDNKLVKRVYVEKRENAIVNRLNKTKVERHPDLREEKAQREREIRKVERMAQQEKVGLELRGLCWMSTGVADMCYRRKKTLAWRKSGRSSSGRRSICMTTCIRRII